MIRINTDLDFSLEYEPTGIDEMDLLPFES